MTSVLISLLQTLRGLARSRGALHVEVLALRHQLHVLQRSRPRRLRLVSADRWLWAWLSRSWTDWQSALVIVKPALRLIADWRRRAATAEPGALMFATRGGKPLSPSNVLRRSVFPACEALGLPHATWLTFRRTSSSWSARQGRAGERRRTADGSRQRAYDVECLHAGTGRLAARGGRESRRRIVHNCSPARRSRFAKSLK